jgi:hypothetical protein
MLSPFPEKTHITVMDQTEVWVDEDGEEHPIAGMTEEELYDALDVLDAHINELHELYAQWEIMEISHDTTRSWFYLSFLSEIDVRTVRLIDPEVWMDSTGLYRALLRAYMEV